MRSLGTVLSHTWSDISIMHVDSEDVEKFISAGHLAQVVLQMVITTLNFYIYMCTCETEVLYTILLCFPDTVLHYMWPYMATNAARDFSGSHEDTCSHPLFQMRIPLFFRSLSLYKRQYEITSYRMYQWHLWSYSGTPCNCTTWRRKGVYKASQFRAAMNHPGGYSKWKEKIVIQVLKL